MTSDLKHRIVQNILLNYSNLSFVDDTPFAWKIETLKQPFTLPVDCKYVDYYCRVVELCVRKYLRSIFNELGKDDYTELFINEGILNTAIRRTFIDHNEDYLWHVRPYDVGCCKFLALSSMVYGTDLKNLENLLDELPQIHDLRLVEILDNIKQYMFPNVGKELYDCRSSKSFIIKIEEENNSGYFLQVIISKDTDIHLKSQYEVTLYMLSNPNFQCKRLIIYNPLLGKIYTAECSFDKQIWNDKFKELKQNLSENLKLI